MSSQARRGQMDPAEATLSRALAIAEASYPDDHRRLVQIRDDLQRLAEVETQAAGGSVLPKHNLPYQLRLA
jgi:hypothetical protein